MWLVPVDTTVYLYGTYNVRKLMFTLLSVNFQELSLPRVLLKI